MNITKISTRAVCRMWNLKLRLGGVIFLMSVCLFRPGSAFKLYDLFNDHKNIDAIKRDRVLDSEPSLLTKVEICIQRSCSTSMTRDATLECIDNCKEIADNMAEVLNDPPYGLRDRELDPEEACIQAKCPNQRDYLKCFIEECARYGSERFRREFKANAGLLGRLFPNSDDAWKEMKRGKVLKRRQVEKRPTDLCTQCYPNDPVGHYPDCRNTCG